MPCLRFFCALTKQYCTIASASNSILYNTPFNSYRFRHCCVNTMTIGRSNSWLVLVQVTNLGDFYIVQFPRIARNSRFVMGDTLVITAATIYSFVIPRNLRTSSSSKLLLSFRNRLSAVFPSLIFSSLDDFHPLYKNSQSLYFLFPSEFKGTGVHPVGNSCFN